MSWEQRRVENISKLFWLRVQWHFQSLLGLISSDSWVAMQSQPWALIWQFHCQLLNKNILKDGAHCFIVLPLLWDSSCSRCRRPWCSVYSLRAFDSVSSESEKNVSPLVYEFSQLLFRECHFPSSKAHLCWIPDSELHQGYQVLVGAAEMFSPFKDQK